MKRRDFIKTSAAIALSPLVIPSLPSPQLIQRNEFRSTVGITPIYHSEPEHEFITYLKENFVGKRFGIYQSKEKDTFKILPWYKELLRRYDSPLPNLITKDRQVGMSTFNLIYLNWQATVNKKRCGFLGPLGSFIGKRQYLVPNVDCCTSTKSIRGTRWNYLVVDEADFRRIDNDFLPFFTASKLIVASTLNPRRSGKPFYTFMDRVAEGSHWKSNITMEEAGIMTPEEIDNYKKIEAINYKKIEAIYESESTSRKT